MIIELIRAHVPEEVGLKEACAICGEQFLTEVVQAHLCDAAHTDLGSVCPTCVAALGSYRPDIFPTREEYEAARATTAVPVWASIEEATRAWEEGFSNSCEAVEQLAERTGISRHEAELRLVDEDLWILPPEQRFEVGESAEKRADAFSDAGTVLAGLAEAVVALRSGPARDAAVMALWDAGERCEEAARRAAARRRGDY